MFHPTSNTPVYSTDGSLRVAVNVGEMGVRLGKEKEDPALWGFATHSLNADEGTMKAFQTKFILFFNRFGRILNTKITTLQKRVEFAELKTWNLEGVKSSIVGSFGNKTNLASFDLDVIVILNEGAEVRYVTKSNKAYWPGGEELSPAVLATLTTEIGKAVNVCLDEQDEDDFELVDYRTDKKCRYTFVCKTPMQEVLEFDILPAFKTQGGDYLLFDNEGKISRTGNELATAKIERLSKDFVGLREMIKTLKFIAKTDLKKLLPSCAFEAAAMSVAEGILGEKWNTAGFVEIFRACLTLIQLKLVDGGKLSPPNNSSEDLLNTLRRPEKAIERKQVEDFLAKWITITPSELLEQLHFIASLSRTNK